ncbi:MAG: nucleotidyltransferase domain-containing protein, partial [Pseudomonadota bacterium]
GIPVDAVILFGSRVSGKGGRDSDIDVCVVSKKFGADPIEEGCFLQRLAHRIDPLIEPIAISLRDYRKNKYLPILHAIRKNGMRIV